MCLYNSSIWQSPSEAYSYSAGCEDGHIFMEPKNLLSCSQELTTFPYRDPDETNVQLAFPGSVNNGY
jgi:hypothetical protein